MRCALNPRSRDATERRGASVPALTHRRYRPQTRRFSPAGFSFAAVGRGEVFLLLPSRRCCSRSARGLKSGGPPPLAASFKVQTDIAHNARGPPKVPRGGQFDYGRIVHWKADRPKRILGTCPNRVIDPVDAARFMTATSTLRRLARSAALNASCAARPSRIGTPLGCLDIGSSPVQLRIRMTTTPNAPRDSNQIAVSELTGPTCPLVRGSPAGFAESWWGQLLIMAGKLA
jgi:hypothetical protein